MSEIIYRPQQKSEQELTNDFVIRLIEFKRLMDSIGNDSIGSIPQHILLQGKRGMGKTTLMYRVFYEVQKTKAESKILPVIFNEEQYSVRTLYKLWEQIASYLEEEKGYEDLFEKMEAMSEAYDYEERCADLLFSYIDKHQHRLLLLIDNFGEMIYKFSRKDLQRLREVLVTTPTIKIIGGSSVVLESFYKYDQPFFDFFKVAHLAPLKQKDVDTLLLRLGEKRKEPHIAEIVNKQKGRVSALRILTGGVPRTIVMLFDIFLDAKQGESMTDLVNLLDKITPLYKYRMDKLPPQQQEIVECLALHWDGMSVGELVKKTRMKSAAISSQLKYLGKSDMVVAQKTTGKNKYYQIEERFFNIWYLVQHGSRKNQQKVIWLTRFLEFWCDEDKETLDLNSLQESKNIEISKISSLLWSDQISEAISYLESVLKELLELLGLEDKRLKEEIGVILEFLIVKGLKNYLYGLFQKEEYQLKDRYKVTYYALLTLMQEEHPNEVRRMGKELKEPVQMMVRKIKKKNEKEL